MGHLYFSHTGPEEGDCNPVSVGKQSNQKVKFGRLWYICNESQTQEAEAEAWWDWDQPGLQNETASKLADKWIKQTEESESKVRAFASLGAWVQGQNPC